MGPAISFSRIGHLRRTVHEMAIDEVHELYVVRIRFLVTKRTKVTEFCTKVAIVGRPNLRPRLRPIRGIRILSVRTRTEARESLDCVRLFLVDGAAISFRLVARNLADLQERVWKLRKATSSDESDDCHVCSSIQCSTSQDGRS